jgi:hypothetical protein
MMDKFGKWVNVRDRETIGGSTTLGRASSSEVDEAKNPLFRCWFM